MKFSFRPNSSTLQRGFTLVEILVALAIIAIAMAALVKASSNHTYSASYIKEKTLAHYVAMNELTLLQLSGDWPEDSEVKKSTEMAEHEWYWTRETEKVVDFVTGEPSERFIKVRFTVYADEDRNNSVANLSGWVSRLATAQPGGSSANIPGGGTGNGGN